MKITYKYLFYVLLIFIPLLVVPSLLEDKKEMLPAENNDLGSNKIELLKHFKKLDNLNLDFPYSSYLKSNNFKEFKSLKHDLNDLDSVFKDKAVVQQFIFTVLTDSLFMKNYNNREVNLDSLNVTLQWAEKFKYYGEADSDNQILFQAIHSYWLSKISNILTKYSEDNDSKKFNFQFRYLVAKCNEKRFNVSVKVSSLEKFVQNILENKWAHLFEASWNQSSLFQKIAIFLLFVLTGYAYFKLFKFYFDKK